jgi:plastocyanin
MRHHRLVLAACVSATIACGSDTSTMPPPNKSYDVFTIGDTFSPSFLTIAAGDTVRFNFAAGGDGMGHDVAFNSSPAGHPANIPVTTSGVVRRVFDTRGTFHYNCFVHPGMAGDVIVE